MKFWVAFGIFCAVLVYGFRDGWFDQLLGLDWETVGENLEAGDMGVLDRLVRAVRGAGPVW